MPIALISHNTCLQHEDSECHPECPARLSAIHDAICESQLEPLIRHYQAIQATREQLCRAHSEAHVAYIFQQAPEHGNIMLDGDTGMNEYSLAASLHAAGALVQAVDLAMAEKHQRFFCAVRPPGHHAEHERAMGFCLFNNIAVGATHALQQHGLNHVAILDFDVHHGNGTEDIFAGNPDVLVCQTFQHPLYPGTGANSIEKNLVNVPLPAGTTGNDFRQAITQHWLPALEEFKPELYFISAGFDAHIEDPLANLLLNESDYAWVTQQIVTLANKHAQGRIISTLEGGYALKALGRSVVAHLEALAKK